MNVVFTELSILFHFGFHYCLCAVVISCDSCLTVVLGCEWSREEYDEVGSVRVVRLGGVDAYCTDPA